MKCYHLRNSLPPPHPQRWLDCQGKVLCTSLPPCETLVSGACPTTRGFLSRHSRDFSLSHDWRWGTVSTCIRPSRPWAGSAVPPAPLCQGAVTPRASRCDTGNILFQHDLTESEWIYFMYTYIIHMASIKYDTFRTTSSFKKFTLHKCDCFIIFPPLTMYESFHIKFSRKDLYYSLSRSC